MTKQDMDKAYTNRHMNRKGSHENQSLDQGQQGVKKCWEEER